MKYIVYKTTNLLNGHFYIGVHKTKDPDIFDGYIGNGIYINQPSTYQLGKTKMQIAVKEFGVKNFRRETLAIFDNEISAYFLESEIVNFEFLARDDVYNMILGGLGGNTSLKPCYQYDTDGNYIKTFNTLLEAADSCNKTFQGIHHAIVYKCKCGDYYWNRDKVDKLDLSAYNDLVLPIKVYRYNAKDGKFDSEFESISKAAKDSNVTIVEVSRSAKLGYKVKEFYFLFVKADSYDKAKSIYINNREVFKYDTDGNFLQGYESQFQAQEDNPGSNITKAIKNKKPDTNGFLWSLEKLPKFVEKRNSKKKKVGKFDTDGNLLQTWESVSDCIKEVGMSRSYVTVGKMYKGYLYKHI